jgi:hypothetical protein
MAIRLSRADMKRLVVATAAKRRAREPRSTVQRGPGVAPVMNKLESRFACQLEAWRLSGEIMEWRAFPSALSLARRCVYHPDFFARFPDGTEVMYEVKGFMREDAAVKLRVAADKFRMYKFVVVRFKNHEWVFTEIRPS